MEKTSTICTMNFQTRQTTSTFIIVNSFGIFSNLGYTDASENKPEDFEEGNHNITTIAVPAFVVIFICLIIFVVRVKFTKKKPVKIMPLKEDLQPTEHPLPLKFKKLIGYGSFGVVWRAVLDCRAVAVKICSTEKFLRWEAERTIFEENLNHPNVVQFIAAEIRTIRDELALLLILENIDKGDLRSFLTTDCSSLEKTLNLLTSFSEGLNFLHSYVSPSGTNKKSIAHRDIKSSNILLSGTRGCVIADFGLAVTLETTVNPEWAVGKLQVS